MIIKVVRFADIQIVAYGLTSRKDAEQLWQPLGSSEGLLDSFGVSWEGLGSLLEKLRRVLGPLIVVLERHRGLLGAVLRLLEVILEPLGTVLGPLETVLGRLGAVLGGS